jgi:hypothetical protein
MLIATDAIERVTSIEMRPHGRGRGFKSVLQDICRAAAGEPTALAAARALDRAPCKVAIVTGAAVPGHMPVGENDGPFGAAVLALKLEQIGHTVTIWTDPEAAPPIEGVLEYLGAKATVGRLLRPADPVQQDAIVAESDVLMAIERLGGNVNGQLYGITGQSRVAFRANVDRIFTEAQAQGKTTIAIGDGGNEVGFGKVHEAILAAIPDHNKAEVTACGGGVLSVVATDILVFATSSNIGAYAVCGALAMLRRDASLCHDADTEDKLHYVGLGLGLVDGGGNGRTPLCDGIPADCNAAIVCLIENIVLRYLDPPRTRPF